jgi:hypothetical protein
MCRASTLKETNMLSLFNCFFSHEGLLQTHRRFGVVHLGERIAHQSTFALTKQVHYAYCYFPMETLASPLSQLFFTYVNDSSLRRSCVSKPQAQHADLINTYIQAYEYSEKKTGDVLTLQQQQLVQMRLCILWLSWYIIFPLCNFDGILNLH